MSDLRSMLLQERSSMIARIANIDALLLEQPPVAQAVSQSISQPTQSVAQSINGCNSTSGMECHSTEDDVERIVVAYVCKSSRWVKARGLTDKFGYHYWTKFLKNAVQQKNIVIYRNSSQTAFASPEVAKNFPNPDRGDDMDEKVKQKIAAGLRFVAEREFKLVTPTEISAHLKIDTSVEKSDWKPLFASYNFITVGGKNPKHFFVCVDKEKAFAAAAEIEAEFAG